MSDPAETRARVVSVARTLVALGILTAQATARAAGSSAERRTEIESLPAVDRSELLSYWHTEHRTPEDYLVGKFADKRWVLVGEYHRIRHDVQLIVDLVPRLHQANDWETVNWGDPARAPGVAHATGKYAEYRMGTGEQLVRMGNLVRRPPYMQDMFFVSLHAPFYDHAAEREIYPFDGVLDRLMLRFNKAIGFDVVGTPFERLAHRERAPRSITAHTFGELYDGYVIFRTPIKQYVGVTCIDDWVTDEDELREFARGLINKSAAERFATVSLEEFRASHCAPRADHGAEFSRRFRHLPEIR